jgi:ankyrin repeat protein
MVLMQKIASGRKDNVWALITQADQEGFLPELMLQRNSRGDSPIVSLIKKGYMNIACGMIDYTQNYDGVEEIDKALLYTAQSNKYGLIKDLLKVPNININVADANGNTALHHAARNGDIQVVELLVNRGADVDIQDQGGNTALHLAAANGNVEVVELLVNRGADINIQNLNGQIADDLANQNNHHNAAPANILQDNALAQLMNNNLNIEANDNNPWDDDGNEILAGNNQYDPDDFHGFS